MAPLRILWLAHRDMGHPRAGGAERSVSEIGKRLSSMGAEVTVFSSGWKGAPVQERIDGVEIQRLWTPVGPHILQVIRELRSSSWDAIVDDLAHLIPWCSPIVTDTPGLAFFHHLHSRTLPGQVPPFFVPMLTRVERMYPTIYRDWTFVTESTSSRADLVDLKIPPSHILTIPPGVNLRMFSPSSRSEKPTIVYFAGLKPYKRPLDVFQAFSKVIRAGQSAHLVVVGSETLMPSARTECDRLGILPYTTFTGRVSEKELSRLVARSWVNVHASVAEGWGFTVTEARAAGVPTVAYDVPGVSESVISGATGVLVEDGSTGALARGLLEIIRSPDRWWGECLRRRSQYDWDETARKWHSTLRMVADGKFRNSYASDGQTISSS